MRNQNGVSSADLYEKTLDGFQFALLRCSQTFCNESLNHASTYEKVLEEILGLKLPEKKTLV